jgi:Mrp family chromosome partitioning ATPase
MSALDQAFIKAFAKESPAAPASNKPRSMPRTERTAPDQASGESLAFDELYDAGTFYRVDTAAERAVPAAHLPPDAKVPRRLQRRGNRAEGPALETPPPAPAVEVHPQALPPRRQWSKSMLEIARQLSRLDLRHTPLSELPPEIIYIEPPLPETPPEPVVPAEQNVAAEPTPDLEIAPQAFANLWPVQSFFSQSAVVELADAETWLATPIAPSIVCNQNLANGWAASDEVATHTVAEPAEVVEAAAAANIEAAFKATVSADAPADDTKSKKKFRIDAKHSRVPVPHSKPAVEINDVVEEAAAEEVAEANPEAKAPTIEPPAPTVPKRPYVPLWEVDRFTWPALCDKLMHDPNGYFASASNKLLSVVRGGLKVLGITGSRRGEGRTTLALCLARAAAQAGIHVALVDADFARPQLANMLGLETAYGWQEAATGKIPLSEAAVKSLADRLTVLPLEVSTSTSKLSLADPRVTATLRATAATFELVIVDLGPLGTSNEPLFPPGENCPLDAAVVVRDVRYALVNESRAAGDRLYDAGIEAVGIAENFVTEPELAFL